MKKYAVIDTDITAGAVENIKVFESKEEAIRRADYFWSMLTSREQEKRDSFIVGLIEVDEHNEPIDGEVIEVIKTFK